MKLFQEEIDERLTLDDLNLFEGGDGENILWSILSPSHSSTSAGGALGDRARSGLVEGNGSVGTKEQNRDIVDDNGNTSRPQSSPSRTFSHHRAAEIRSRDFPALEQTSSVKKVVSPRPPSASTPTSTLQPLTPPSSPGTPITLQAVSNLI